MKKNKGVAAIALSFVLDNLLAVILSLICVSVFGIILDTKFDIIVYVINAFIFAFLMYHQAWNFGVHDLENKSGNRLAVVASGSVIAVIPNWIMAVISVSGVEIVKKVFCIWNFPLAMEDAYLTAYPFLYVIPCITIPVIAIVGYILGYKRIKLIDYLYYERDKKE